MWLMEVWQLLQAELEARAWVQVDLARVLGWPVQTISELRQGKRGIDARMAVDLEALTDKKAEEWLMAQASDDLAQARRISSAATRSQQIEARALVESQVPVRELMRRGVITSKDPHIQAEQVADLLGPDPTFGASAKRTKNATPFTRAQTAWIALARKAADAKKIKPYNEAAFDGLAAALPRLATTPESFKQLPAFFAEVGVALVHVEPFPGGRIDGVSLGQNGQPVIALSGRGKRLDKVLFALLHECAHVTSGHWKEAPRVHEGNSEWVVGDDDAERTVSRIAASWLFPDGLDIPPGVITRKTISDLAEKHKVSPSVVVGHLQHKGIIQWSSTLGRGLPNVEEALSAWQ